MKLFKNYLNEYYYQTKIMFGNKIIKKQSNKISKINIKVQSNFKFVLIKSKK